MSEHRSPMRPALWLFMILLLATLSLSMASGLVHADSNPFIQYTPGVTPGTVNTYDSYGYLGIPHAIIIITVNQVYGDAINFTERITDVYGNSIQNVTYLLNLTTGSSGYLPFFTGASLQGGPLYPGSSQVLAPSILGHIVLGNYRQTNYWDIKLEKYVIVPPGTVNHMEFDRATGIMLKYADIYNGAGTYVSLRSTTLWGPNFFWYNIGATMNFFGTTWIFFLSAIELYLGGFLIVGLYDWHHVRQLRAIHGRKGGSSIPYKMFIIGALIMGSIMIALIIVVQLILAGVMGG